MQQKYNDEFIVYMYNRIAELKNELNEANKRNEQLEEENKELRMENELLKVDNELLKAVRDAQAYLIRKSHDSNGEEDEHFAQKR